MVEWMLQCRAHASSNIRHAGLSSSVEYQTFPDSKSYSEAHVACQGYNYKHLAKINELDELTQAKTASGYSNLEKYWTALQVL